MNKVIREERVVESEVGVWGDAKGCEMVPWRVASKSTRKTEPRTPLKYMVLNSEFIFPDGHFPPVPAHSSSGAEGLQGRPGGGWMGQQWGHAGNAF